jgi:hypothetical protein
MRRALQLLTGTFVAALVVAALPEAASAAAATTCDGVLAPGSYGAVTVPAGGACQSDGPIDIRGGLWVQPGATFVLGTEESTNTGTIRGGVHATDPGQLEIHFATIKGGVDWHGGSGAFCGEECVFFATIEDSDISGGVVVDGYDGFWMGFIRNHVRGAVTMTNNVSLFDDDSNEYVTNVIRGTLNCTGNSPAPHVGDSEGDPNVVTGAKTGQCAVNV